MKYLLRFITLCLIVVGIFLGQIFFKGFIRYKAIHQDDYISETVEKIKSQDNYVSLSEIPLFLKQSTVAVEDKRFYHHIGFDVKSTLRAFMMNTVSGEIVSGGSTISQQLAKNLFLTFEKTYERKVTELMLALTLEEMYSKDEILELYLNVINYGDGQNGIYMAAKHYFDKDVMDLSESECILLAGLPQSPTYYNLNHNIDNAYKRADQVIYALISDDVLSHDLKQFYKTTIREVRIAK